MNILNNLKASRAVGEKNYDLAIAEYKNIIEVNHQDQFAISMLAICHELKNDKTNALKYAGHVLEIDPNNFEMLLLSARCWSDLSDADLTYHYVCRALKNAEELSPEIPPWFFKMIKLLAIFKKFRGLESKARIEHSNNANYREECLEWARKYKAWYEANTFK